MLRTSEMESTNKEEDGVVLDNDQEVRDGGAGEGRGDGMDDAEGAEMMTDEGEARVDGGVLVVGTRRAGGKQSIEGCGKELYGWHVPVAAGRSRRKVNVLSAMFRWAKSNYV